jgi:hypothetical protein
MKGRSMNKREVNIRPVPMFLSVDQNSNLKTVCGDLL